MRCVPSPHALLPVLPEGLRVHQWLDVLLFAGVGCKGHIHHPHIAPVDVALQQDGQRLLAVVVVSG